MSDVAIRIAGLGKEYRLGAQRERYHTFVDQIRRWTSIHRWLNRSRHAEDRPPFWALKDVSFEVKRGEVVGIIGRNGAGKSTLLKILSRITEPTEGGVDINGRVGSLLEVGTGFHPELTGRENVYLNGAILGMRRAEIVRKFDEIVGFAEVEKFIDTPVKHYSSGMYTRLAFAVAAHLESEILVVDEVLAVGDVAFQKKCLGKMGEVARGGRTILFVSHNMAAIEALTTRCVYLNHGRVAVVGSTADAKNAYLEMGRLVAGERPSLEQWVDRKGSGQARVIELKFMDTYGQPAATFAPRSPITVQLIVRFSEPTTADIAVVIETEAEQPIFTTHLGDTRALSPMVGEVRLAVTIDPNLLRQGRYLVSVAIGSANWADLIDVIYHFPAFEIAGHPASGSFPLDARWGPLYLEFPWLGP